MKRTEPRFVVCVKNKGYAASLELRKLYRVVSDEPAAKLHQICVIDESGEDYLYPEEYFVAVERRRRKLIALQVSCVENLIQWIALHFLDARTHSCIVCTLVPVPRRGVEPSRGRSGGRD